MNLYEVGAFVECPAADLYYRVGDDDFGQVGAGAEGFLANFF